jgi:outer membrane protein TolC
MTSTLRAAVTIAVLVPACATGIAHAQETITLDEAILRAQQRSARIEEIDARRAAAAAAESGRAAARLPAVSLLAGYTRTNHVQEFSILAPGQPPRVIYPDVPDNFRSRIDLQWPIYTGGRAEALLRAASAESRATGEDVQSARADLRLEVTRAFWAIATAREAERVVAHALENLETHVRDLRARLDQGLIPPNDVTFAEAQRSRQRLLSIEATNTRAIAEADLRRLIGGDGPVTPATTLEAVAAAAAPVQPASGAAGAERRALNFRLDASRAREQAVRAIARPQISAGGGYDFARPNPRIFPRIGEWQDSWDASINLSWSLWDGGRRRAEQAEAAAATRGVQARLTEFERQVAFELQQRQLELDSARSAIAASADGVASAAETRRVVGERYRAGVVTSTDVLDAELALLQAELDRTRALSAAALAEARLDRARAR